MLINNVMPDIWKVLSTKRRGQAKIFVFLSIGSTILEALSLGLVMPLLILMTKGNVDWSSSSGFMSFLRPVMVNFSLEELTFAIILIYTLKNLYLGWVLSFQSKFIFGVEKDLSVALFRTYLEQPYNLSSHQNK